MVTHPVAACGASPNNNPEHLRSYANRQATAAIISGWLASRVQFCQISCASQINKRTHCPFASPAGCRREPSPRPPVSHTYSLRRTLTAYLRLRYIIQVLLLLVPEQVVPTSPSKSKYCGPAESRLNPPWQWRERRAGVSLSARSEPAERHATLTAVH